MGTSSPELELVSLPLVSVVIPAYNSERYIAEAVNSALSQDYPNIEVLVIDDGSTDRTVEVVQQFAHKVKLLQQENQGSASARNLGISEARGKYIAFLDADDVWIPQKVQIQIVAMETNGFKMAYSRFIWWHPDANGNHPSAVEETALQNNSNISSAALVTGWLYPELLLDCIVWTSTVIVEKAELEAVGKFDSNYRKGQDYDLWLKLSRRIAMLGLETPTALYRIHADSITSTTKAVNYEYVILSSALERWSEIGPDGRSPKPGLVRTRLARSAFGHGVAHLRHGLSKIAIESFLLSITHPRFFIKSLLYLISACFRRLVGTLNDR